MIEVRLNKRALANIIKYDMNFVGNESLVRINKLLNNLLLFIFFLHL